jgi:hypothetical protein
MSRSEVALSGLIGKALRAAFEDTERQPLPKRWIDLIRHLDERERQQSAAERSYCLRRDGRRKTKT